VGFSTPFGHLKRFGLRSRTLLVSFSFYVRIGAAMRDWAKFAA
jgi:hypothetical protein